MRPSLHLDVTANESTHRRTPGRNSPWRGSARPEDRPADDSFAPSGAGALTIRSTTKRSPDLPAAGDPVAAAGRSSGSGRAPVSVWSKRPAYRSRRDFGRARQPPIEVAWPKPTDVTDANDSMLLRGELIGYLSENRPTAVNQPKPVSTGTFVLQFPFGFFGKTPVKPVFARVAPVIPWYAPSRSPSRSARDPSPGRGACRTPYRDADGP